MILCYISVTVIFKLLCIIIPACFNNLISLIIYVCRTVYIRSAYTLYIPDIIICIAVTVIGIYQR